MTRSINYEIAHEIASIRAAIATFELDYAGVLLQTKIAREEYAALWARLEKLQKGVA